MLAMARHIPEATQSTTGGKWEKKKFMGSELRGKSLGIVGLGSIGREVVKRARAFEMRVQAYDPYVTAQIAKDLGVELVDLAALYAQSDYITLHVALTPETEGMLSHDAFAQMKPGVRIVNCARGELIDEEALRQALDSGKVASAALDVFRWNRRRRVTRCSRGTKCWPRRTSAARPKKRRRSWACASPSRWSSI
jgi:D-3-phosphoglycerate dehydrogenase